MLVIFSQYLRNFKMPVPFYTKRDGFHIIRTNFIKLFPVSMIKTGTFNKHFDSARSRIFFKMRQVLITIVLAWILCLILTETGALSNDPNVVGYRARTDVRVNVLTNSPW